MLRNILWYIYPSKYNKVGLCRILEDWSYTLLRNFCSQSRTPKDAEVFLVFMFPIMAISIICCCAGWIICCLSWRRRDTKDETEQAPLIDPPTPTLLPKTKNYDNRSLKIPSEPKTNHYESQNGYPWFIVQFIF